MKIQTFADLKEFLDSCSDEQLKNSPLHVCGVDTSGITLNEVDVLSEDYFVSDDGLIPVISHDPDVNKPLNDCHIVPKGTIYLYYEQLGNV